MIISIVIQSEQRYKYLHLFSRCSTVISKFPLLILNKNRWSTNYIPALVGTESVEVFLPLGLNQVQGLILGLVFQVGGLRLSRTRV